MQIPSSVSPDTKNDSRRRPRYSFVADIEVSELQSEIQIRDRTKALSMCGGGVDTENLFPKGTKVRIKIAHGGSTFEAFGRVAYARPTLGMGIVFTSVEPESDQVLKGWLANYGEIND
jgi:hypothetical protein